VTDPRYDPRFQRGWDGAPPSAPPPQPVRHGSAESVPEEPPPRPAAPAPDPVADETPDVDEVDVDEPERRRNPFRIALVVLGIALIAVAAALFWQTAEPRDGSGDTPATVAIQGLGYTFGPTLLLVGIVAIIVAIALGTVRRR
jgi:H+/Cl- antiporter ClcA